MCGEDQLDGYLKVLFSNDQEIYIGYGWLRDHVALPEFRPSESLFLANILQPASEWCILLDYDPAAREPRITQELKSIFGTGGIHCLYLFAAGCQSSAQTTCLRLVLESDHEKAIRL